MSYLKSHWPGLFFMLISGKQNKLSFIITKFSFEIISLSKCTGNHFVGCECKEAVPAYQDSNPQGRPPEHVWHSVESGARMLISIVSPLSGWREGVCISYSSEVLGSFFLYSVYTLLGDWILGKWLHLFSSYSMSMVFSSECWVSDCCDPVCCNSMCTTVSCLVTWP